MARRKKRNWWWFVNRPFMRWRHWRWVRWVLVAMTPLVLLNLAVAFFGNSIVFPLSPFFVRNKLSALGSYAWHRPHCVWSGHGSLDADVVAAETRHHLPRGLLAAIVSVESSGRVHRISFAGAMGPGQLTPATARLLGVADPFDPPQALDGSARYLATQLAAFHDVRLAVAAYNAGPGAIVNRTVPHNGETEAYVRKVMAAYATLHPPAPRRLAGR
jgi:soluble lytic murein transglycosylase-like protein